MNNASYILGSGILRSESREDEDVFSEFKEWCEKLTISDDGKWGFTADLSDAEYRNIADGEFQDMITQNFSVLMDLKRYHNGVFEVHVVVGDPYPELFHLDESTISMCASLGMDISITQAQAEQDAHDS
jgi:hypothetical protein